MSARLRHHVVPLPGRKKITELLVADVLDAGGIEKRLAAPEGHVRDVGGRGGAPRDIRVDAHLREARGIGGAFVGRESRRWERLGRAAP